MRSKPFVYRGVDGSRVIRDPNADYRLSRSIPAALKTDRGILYNCDCMHLLRDLRAESVDCVFADPPFNLGKDYGHAKVNDRLDKKIYLDWSYSWLEECCRVLKPGGALFVYILPQWAFHFASYLDQALEFRHWIAVSMKGTFPRGKKLYPAHYALLYFTKGTPDTFNRDDVRVPIPKCRHCGGDIKDYGGHRKYLNPRGLNLTDIWDDTSPNRHRKFKYRKINELKSIIPERAIRIATSMGQVVLDPFGGGGSTFEAAERLGRLWIGSEIADVRPIVDRMTALHSLPRGEPPKRLRRVFQSIAADWSLGSPTEE